MTDTRLSFRAEIEHLLNLHQQQRVFNLYPPPADVLR